MQFQLKKANSMKKKNSPNIMLIDQNDSDAILNHQITVLFEQFQQSFAKYC